MLPNTPFDDYSHLLQVVDFAIRQEQEAVAFYGALALRAKRASTAAELRRIGAMEEDHRARLEMLNVAEAASTVPATLRQINLDDYKVPHELDPNMEREDIFNLAIAQEVAAMALYSGLANLIPDSVLKQLFLNLASEEVLHKQYLETLPPEEF
jgi:rubrerythrin